MRHAASTFCLVALLAACGPQSSGPGPDTSTDAGAATADLPAAEMPCLPACQGKECGPDGCGGVCGVCTPGALCLTGGGCEPCVPQCTGKECGSDACGGSCGECGECFICGVGGYCEQEHLCWPRGWQCSNVGESFGSCPCETCKETETHCDEETHKCVEPHNYPNQCPGIFDCMNDCPDGDQDCQQNCINSASIDTQMAFNNLNQCWIDVFPDECWFVCPEGSKPEDCPEEYRYCTEDKATKCEDEYFACFIPGDLTCEEIFDCFDTCPADDTPCMQECFQNGTKEGQKTASAMWDCYEDAGVYDCWGLCPDDAQSTDDCPAEAQQCFDETLAECQDETDACFPSEEA